MLSRDLDAVAVRVLGSLIEKELATPDHYPLSLNALTSACNQLSNREPVMALDEREVAAALDDLRRRGLVRSIQSVGSRVPKYRHLLGEFDDLDRPKLAVLCVLSLRGPQTAAEVRTRAGRLLPGDAAGSMDAALDALAGRDPEPLAVRLPRRPGQKEARFAHLLSGEVGHLDEEVPSEVPTMPGDRISALEEAVRGLRGEIADLQVQFAALRKQLE